MRRGNTCERAVGGSPILHVLSARVVHVATHHGHHHTATRAVRPEAPRHTRLIGRRLGAAPAPRTSHTQPEPIWAIGHPRSPAMKRWSGTSTASSFSDGPLVRRVCCTETCAWSGPMVGMWHRPKELRRQVPQTAELQTFLWVQSTNAAVQDARILCEVYRFLLFIVHRYTALSRSQRQRSRARRERAIRKRRRGKRTTPRSGSRPLARAGSGWPAVCPVWSQPEML